MDKKLYMELREIENRLFEIKGGLFSDPLDAGKLLMACVDLHDFLNSVESEVNKNDKG